MCSYYSTCWNTIKVNSNYKEPIKTLIISDCLMIIGIKSDIAIILLSKYVNGRTVLSEIDDDYTMDSKKLTQINSMDTVKIRQTDSWISVSIIPRIDTDKIDVEFIEC